MLLFENWWEEGKGKSKIILEDSTIAHIAYSHLLLHCAQVPQLVLLTEIWDVAVRTIASSASL